MTREKIVHPAYLQWYIVQNYGVTYGDPKALYTQPGADDQQPLAVEPPSSAEGLVLRRAFARP